MLKQSWHETPAIGRASVRPLDADGPLTNFARADDSLVFFLHLGVHIVVFVATIVAAGSVDHWLWRSILAALCGASMVQIGFAGHDIEHGQVTRRPVYRRWLGLMCWNFFLGLSAHWWQDKHCAHHRNTHVEGVDPDLYTLYAFDDACASRAKGVHRLFIRHQQWSFWISLVFARLYFQWLSIAFLVSRPSARRCTELCLILAHHLSLWWAVSWALPQHTLAFIAVGYAVAGGYMGLVFSTNHLGMPLASGAGVGKLWQIAHTRNIRTGQIGNYLFGGLNFQIEHHLYPSLSRFRLQALVQPTRQRCSDAGVPYHEQGMFAALRDINASFRRVSCGMKK